MRRAGRYGALGTCLALTATLAACGGSESPATRYARDPEAVERGRLIFVGTCGAYCHSMQPGVREAPDLFDCHWKNGDRDRDLFRVIASGVPETRMVGFAEALPEGEEDIWKLIAFLRVHSRCEGVPE